MEESLRFLRGPAHRAGHEVVYLPREHLIGGKPDGIEDALVLQVLVDVGYREGRVPPQVELLFHVLVPVYHGGEELPPAVCRVDVAGPQDRPLAVPEIVETEERVVAG